MRLEKPEVHKMTLPLTQPVLMPTHLGVTGSRGLASQGRQGIRVAVVDLCVCFHLFRFTHIVFNDGFNDLDFLSMCLLFAQNPVVNKFGFAKVLFFLFFSF